MARGEGRRRRVANSAHVQVVEGERSSAGGDDGEGRSDGEDARVVKRRRVTRRRKGRPEPMVHVNFRLRAADVRFVRREAKRLEVSESWVIRRLMALGMAELEERPGGLFG